MQGHGMSTSRRSQVYAMLRNALPMSSGGGQNPSSVFLRRATPGNLESSTSKRFLMVLGTAPRKHVQHASINGFKPQNASNSPHVADGEMLAVYMLESGLAHRNCSQVTSAITPGLRRSMLKTNLRTRCFRMYALFWASSPLPCCSSAGKDASHPSKSFNVWAACAEVLGTSRKSGVFATIFSHTSLLALVDVEGLLASTELHLYRGALHMFLWLLAGTGGS